MPNNLEEIKSRLDIVDIISEYIKLNQAGINFKAQCPFHKEKTPSFFISPEKQIFHCFGCGVGGDIFEFVKRIEGVEFPEALRILAQKANVKIDYSYNPELQNKKTKTLDIIQCAVNFYHKNLLESENAKIARDYLENRGVTREAIDMFNLGYSEDSWDSLLKFLKSKAYSELEIETTGLILKSQKGGFSFYDRFRNRLMFPINNIFGETVGFTARILLKDDNQGKYVNSPQSEIFDKGSVLYNMDLAKLDIKNKNYTILVEGNIDAISTYMYGTKNVVATSGTALTPQQVKILKRYSENLIIAYDGDSAGIKATFRIVDNALNENMNIKVAVLPTGVDPDDLIRQGKEKWIDVIKNAKPLMDFVFSKIIESVDLSNIFQKKQAAKKLLLFISKYRDEIERETYLKKLSELIDVDFKILKSKVNEILSKKVVAEKKNYKEDFALSEKNKREELLKQILALGIAYPENLEHLAMNLEMEYLGISSLDELYKDAVIYYTKNNSFDLDNFSNNLGVEEKNVLNSILFIFENQYSDLGKNNSFVEIQKIVIDYKKQFLIQKLKLIELDLKKAELAGHTEKVDELANEFIYYTQKLNNLS
ncbi:MAG: DNA primase [Patescibacteria group bacterium]|nr:DNA primase [Patescibacteria group bacterium]